MEENQPTANRHPPHDLPEPAQTSTSRCHEAQGKAPLRRTQPEYIKPPTSPFHSPFHPPLFVLHPPSHAVSSMPGRIRLQIPTIIPPSRHPTCKTYPASPITSSHPYLGDPAMMMRSGNLASGKPLRLSPHTHSHTHNSNLTSEPRRGGTVTRGALNPRRHCSARAGSSFGTSFVELLELYHTNYTPGNHLRQVGIYPLAMHPTTDPRARQYLQGHLLDSNTVRQQHTSVPPYLVVQSTRQSRPYYKRPYITP